VRLLGRRVSTPSTACGGSFGVRRTRHPASCPQPRQGRWIQRDRNKVPDVVHSLVTGCGQPTVPGGHGLCSMVTIERVGFTPCPGDRQPAHRSKAPRVQRIPALFAEERVRRPSGGVAEGAAPNGVVPTWLGDAQERPPTPAPESPAGEAAVP